MHKTIVIVAALLVPAAGIAQDAQKSLSATMEVYVFPKDGQDAATQSKDESACYDWAVTNAGADPFALKKQQEATDQKAEQGMQAAQQAGAGAGARGAVGGAAAGALIGEIASDDAGEGAAWGAALGAIRGRRMQREAQQQAATKTAAEYVGSTEATAEQLDNFKKAFSVCLEAKNYMVKY